MSSDLKDRPFVVRFFDSFLQERNIKWMLALGTLILFGSSVKLISTHWNETSAAWKHVILLAYTVTIGITASQSYWRFGLRTTGTVLMALTVLLLPVTFLAWHWVWSETAHDFWSTAFNLTLLAVNLVAGWKLADGIFCHLLRGRQPTFVASYLALAAAGAFVPRLPGLWPLTALAMWGVLTVGSVKVHRHVFWLAEERRLPRIFGFFPIALLGTQFLLLFAFYLAPGIPLQWLGLACVLFAVPVLSTADAAASVFRQRTGDLVRPIPLTIILPMFVGLTLCAVGVCVSATELPQPTALVPTAAAAATILAVTAARTKKTAFVWAMLACAMLSYNFSYVFFMDLARLVVQQGAHAVREQRLPYAFYGLTYLPFLVPLTIAAVWARRTGSELFAGPFRRFVIGLSCLLLAAAFQHEKAVFPVSAAMLGVFGLQLGVFRQRLLIAPSIAAFVGASFGVSQFVTGVCGSSVPPDMQLVCMATAAALLLHPGTLVDRYVGNLPGAFLSGGTRPFPALCQSVSLALTLLLTVGWCRMAFLSHTPTELFISEALLLALLVIHAAWRQSTRLAEIALVFAGIGAVICAVHLGRTVIEIIDFGTATLLVLWLGSYVLARIAPCGIGLVCGPVFGRAARNISAAGLLLAVMFSALPQLAWGTLGWAHPHAWFCLVLIVAWAFDAARRFASPVHTLLGCLGVLGLATAVLTEFLGVAASREWLLTACGATALAGSLPAVRLGDKFAFYKHSGGQLPDDERRRAVYFALWGPLQLLVLVSLAAIAVASVVLFSIPARVAGATAVAGLLLLATSRRQPEMRVAALIALNWQLLSGVVEACGADGVFAFPDSPVWLVPASLPLAVAAATSDCLFIFIAARSLNDVSREFVQAHRVLMKCAAAGALLASLGNLPHDLSLLQIVAAAMTFAILIAGTLWQACRLQDVKHVWLAEALTGVAFAYFVLFGVIQLGTGIAPILLLAIGLALWGIGQATASRQAVGILSQPFRRTGMLLPLAAVVLAAGRHLAGLSTTMLGTNSLVLLGAAAFYFWNGLELRRRGLVVLSAVILNGSLALLWGDLSWTDPQLFLIPLGLSVLGLVELLRAEIPPAMHNPLRYAGALVILVSPTFHIISGSWVHLFTLMAASVVVTLLSIGLRVRALMYTGVAFLIADLLAMLVRGSIDRPNLLWIAGIGLGTAVVILGAVCENRREVLMQRLRILTAQLETWR